MSDSPALVPNDPKNKKYRGKSPDIGKLDPRLRRIRALKMLELKLMRNYSRKEIAEEMRLSVMTIDRELSWAKRADLFVQLEDRMLEELAPAAVGRLVREMQNEDGSVNVDGDAGIALKALEMIVGKRGAGKDGIVNSQTDSLEAYIARKRHLAGIRDKSIDGELLGGDVAGYLPSISGDQPPAPESRDAQVGLPFGQQIAAAHAEAATLDTDGQTDDLVSEDLAGRSTAT